MCTFTDEGSLHDKVYVYWFRKRNKKKIKKIK